MRVESTKGIMEWRDVPSLPTLNFKTAHPDNNWQPIRATGQILAERRKIWVLSAKFHSGSPQEKEAKSDHHLHMKNATNPRFKQGHTVAKDPH